MILKGMDGRRYGIVNVTYFGDSACVLVQIE